MNVLAAGRASQIVDLGEGRVLRRFKGGGNPAREAAIMEHARRFDFPVPRVLDVRDDSLVLERIDGSTMSETVRRRPFTLARAARSLAELHTRLHEIPFEDARLLHLDLHPDNVLLSPNGPVAVDWTNARAGSPPLDVAMTWVICATSAGFAGRAFTSLFLRYVDRAAARGAMAEAVGLRLADPNVTDAERSRACRLLTEARQ